MKSFDASSAYRFMERLVKDIGNRESATDSERMAAQQIKTWSEELGLAGVRTEEFEVQTSQILKEEASLPDGTRIECTAVGNSLSTPPEGVEASARRLKWKRLPVHRAISFLCVWLILLHMTKELLHHGGGGSGGD